jgi:hypothetical protein
VRTRNVELKREFYLLVEDAVLLVDIINVSRVLVWTLSRKFATFVEAGEAIDQ